MSSINDTPMKEENSDPTIQARLESIMSERYIHTTRNKDLWELLCDLMLQVNHESPKPKVMGCLITGKPHSGKTTAIRQFKKAYLDNRRGAKDQDVVIFQIPSRAQLKGVIYKLGNLIKIPDFSITHQGAQNKYPTFVLVEKVAKKLWLDGTKLVIIDEFQKLFELSSENRAEILSGFNDMVNESHIPIVLVGVDGVDKILDLDNYDDQSNLRGTFGSRFMEFHFQPWEEGRKVADEIVFDPDFLRLFYTVCKECGLPTTITKTDDLNMIIEMTEGLTGKIIHLIKWTARYMIRHDERAPFSINMIAKAFSEIRLKGWGEQRQR